MSLPHDDGTFAGGLRAVQDKVFLLSVKYQEQQTRANRVGAHVEILDFERALIRRLRKMYVPMFAHSFVRSYADQDAMYVKGVTKARGGESPHNWGMAVDIVHGQLGWDLPNKAWLSIGHIGKEVAASLGVKMTWGGDFKSLWDPAHWELADWRALAIETET